MKNDLNPIDSAEKLYNWSQTIVNSKVEYIFCKEVDYKNTEKFTNKRCHQGIRCIEGTQSSYQSKIRTN